MTLIDTDGGFRVSRRIYHDPEIHRRELDSIFKKSWFFVGHESEIPDPGDYVTRPLGVDPVIVNRDRDGRVHVMLNSCSHRGVKICRSGRGNTKAHRCSYHGWAYGLDGACRAVTYEKEVYGQGFDKSRFDLRSARVGTLHGLIFATWDQRGPSLADALGHMTYYFDALFGKFDRGFEVMGSPVRTRIAANWKAETENLSGDGYHTMITHETALRFGLFPSPDDVAPYGDPIGEKFPGRTVQCGNGHTIRVQHLPIETDPPGFLGYPEELWPQIEQNLKPGQVDIMARTSVTHGSVFPNLSFLENFKTATDGPGSMCRYTRLTLKVPIDEGSTEIWWWHLVPADASETWKERSQRAYLRTNGPGGMFELDDNENFLGMAEANSGPVGLDQFYNYVAGTHHPDAHGLEWPGHVQDADRSEHTLRGFLTEWRRRMELTAVSEPAGSGR